MTDELLIDVEDIDDEEIEEKKEEVKEEEVISDTIIKSAPTDIPLFRVWLDEKRKLSDSTIYCYMDVIKRFISKYSDVSKLETYNEFIVKYAIKKRNSHYYSALRWYIEYKIEDNALKNSLIRGLIVPPMGYSDYVRERQHLTESEIYELINRLQKPKHKVIALLQSVTGVRAGDVLRLKRDNIMPEQYKGEEVLRINFIGKGNKRNVVFVHDKIAQDYVMDYITTYYNVGNYYFIELGRTKGRRGDKKNHAALMKMNYLWFWKDIKQGLEGMGINRERFATHDFRRCFARRAWEKFGDVHILKHLLNHSDPKVTLRYLEQSGLQNVDYHKAMQN